MNIVLDEAEEYKVKEGTRKSMGKILLKGDNITLIQQIQPWLGDKYAISFNDTFVYDVLFML